MKNIIFLVVISFCSCCPATGQEAKRDSIRNSIQLEVQSVNNAADSFLNPQLPVEVRLKAIAPHPVVFNEEQVVQFKRILTSTDESPEIRAMALNKIYQHVDSDENLFNQVLGWFANPETPKPLRDQTLAFIGNISYSSFAGATDVYKKMVRDPDMKFREFAFSRLVRNGDDAAQLLLIRGLQEPQSALLDPVTSVELLAASPKKDFYPVAYKILQETKNDTLRYTVLNVLGPYKEAREKIVAISRDANETEEFRTAALLALYSGDRDNIINYVAPLLRDSTASENLQILGIQLGINVRKAMSYRRKAKKADDFDNLIRDIAGGRGVLRSRQVREVANKYLLLVRPVF